jgi:pyruvate/2-oxoacid:ferredoxin oxidoreductase alpha subunit
VIGQMMEPVSFPTAPIEVPAKPWALRGDRTTRSNLISSFHMLPEELERHLQHLEQKYDEARQSIPMAELDRAEDAEIIVLGYGIVARLLQSAIEEVRKLGIRAGLFRPITLWPFPSRKLRRLADETSQLLVVELSNGQLVDDVRLAVEGRCPVHFYGRVGGVLPTVTELVTQIVELSGASVNQATGIH